MIGQGPGEWWLLEISEGEGRHPGNRNDRTVVADGGKIDLKARRRGRARVDVHSEGRKPPG